ncbi:hypothetical protein BU24DRAFT_59706 [Aaosphaeria arxii CBS 175.79]|uniref:Uncharacterized protein n=1 Tax=Aaosphaeria arxii CBS 175.79 TaxID=1450172 RepID=A0A6A5XCB6_9PLEO|nr:uncharacterized protein BU24DRAFT_59706 [Aaosphaeria arxii CBS 175.79]KAF2010531.1 hypothetical protein BU24DRAFT_59706 [Aaosphaeria arxii CBS 175.79]
MSTTLNMLSSRFYTSPSLPTTTNTNHYLRPPGPVFHSYSFFYLPLEQTHEPNPTCNLSTNLTNNKGLVYTSGRLRSHSPRDGQCTYPPPSSPNYLVLVPILSIRLSTNQTRKQPKQVDRPTRLGLVSTKQPTRLTRVRCSILSP